ncbi:MAG: hypothetical protein JWN64_159 [Parcubacteria group bacterium]|nr:hypothetical protein [Parcubacteria group bacterium]
MKTVYLIRHGESEANVGMISEMEAPALTEKGQQQAAFLAERASRLPVQAIVASTLLRAEQTAEAVAKRTGLALETSPLFVERSRASIQTDKPKDHEDFVIAEQNILANFTVPGYRFADEENFDDLKERAQKALQYLEERPEEHILVVTHGFFLRALIAQVTFGEALTAHECDRMMWSFRTQNTGLTIIKYDETKDRPWWVYTWNDHAHLG